LMYPVFLALMHQYRPPSTLPEDFLSSDREIIRAMNVFITFANETREQNRSASYALKYACQNWADHLLRAPNHKLNDVFQLFWNRYLLSWLERQWCLKGLRSCLVVLSQGQKLVMVCVFPAILDIPSPDVRELILPCSRLILLILSSTLSTRWVSVFLF
jgi:hypothetical protein